MHQQHLTGSEQRKDTHRRPPRLRNEHLRLIRQGVRRIHILSLEELRRPGRRLVNAHIREPRVHVRHPVVHGLQHRRAEVTPRVCCADGNRLRQVERGEHVARVGNIGEQQLCTLCADGPIGVVTAAVGSEVAINRVSICASYKYACVEVQRVNK